MFPLPALLGLVCKFKMHMYLDLLLDQDNFYIYISS